MRPRSPKGRAQETARRLAEEYPDAACALIHRNAFQLLVATILSAQANDEQVNKVTPALFRAFPTPKRLAAASTSDVEHVIKTLGLFRSKAKNLVGMAAALVDRHAGEVPSAMEDLTKLPGVGRKTANVVRSVALGEPGLPVDTHVTRLSRRLGLTEHTDPVKIEYELNGMIPPGERGVFSLRLILHGRRVCIARRPQCPDCVLEEFCPSSLLRARPGRNKRNRSNVGTDEEQVPAT